MSSRKTMSSMRRACRRCACRIATISSLHGPDGSQGSKGHSDTTRDPQRAGGAGGAGGRSLLPPLTSNLNSELKTQNSKLKSDNSVQGAVMDLFRDLRFAARLLVKDRWFTLMAVVVLALGIGANNAVFTIVNAVLIRNLPLPNPNQIMFVGTRDTRGRNLGVSLRDFEDWRAAARTFSGMSFIFSGSFNVGNEG